MQKSVSNTERHVLTATTHARHSPQAFDANLDVAVALGWANNERFCLENFAAVSSTLVSLNP